MSVTGKRGVGIPLILMHDAEGTIVTIETQNGDSYRGFLDEAEDNMNCILKDVTKTTADGRKSQVDHVFLRGSHIAFMIFPSMLKKAPIFNRVPIWKKFKGNPPQGAQGAQGVRGQAAAIIRKAQARRSTLTAGRGAGPIGAGGPPRGPPGGGMGPPPGMR